jgi:tetratricopeptide (TPR) repeat protein
MVSGDVEGAIESLRKATAMKAKLPSAQLDLANALYEGGDLQNALTAYELASEQDLDNEAPRALAGMCHLQVGDAKAAERAFDSAIGIAPDYTLAWLGKGKVLMAKGRPKRAMKFLREAVRIDNQLLEARLAMAECHSLLGEREPAIREARRALAIDPGSEDALALMERLGGSVPEAKVGATETVEEDRDGALKTQPPPPPSSPEVEVPEPYEEIPPPPSDRE